MVEVWFLLGVGLRRVRSCRRRLRRRGGRWRGRSRQFRGEAFGWSIMGWQYPTFTRGGLIERRLLSDATAASGQLDREVELAT